MGVYGSVLFIFYVSANILSIQQLIFTTADLFFFFLFIVTSLAIMISRQAEKPATNRPVKKAGNR
jgi:hypothetical protein